MRLLLRPGVRVLKAYDLQLWGGDTVRAAQGFAGLTVHGLVPQGQMLTRSGAQNGDDVYVTGTIGDGFLDLSRWRRRLCRAAAASGIRSSLRGLAHAAIDVSDGLIADLDHLCVASEGGMDIRRSLFRFQKPERRMVTCTLWSAGAMICKSPLRHRRIKLESLAALGVET